MQTFEKLDNIGVNHMVLLCLHELIQMTKIVDPPETSGVRVLAMLGMSTGGGRTV